MSQQPLKSVIVNRDKRDVLAFTKDGKPLMFRTVQDARLFASRELVDVVTHSDRFNDRHDIVSLMPYVLDGFADVCPVCDCVVVASPLSPSVEHKGRPVHADCAPLLIPESTQRKIDDGTELYAIARYLRDTLGNDEEADLIEGIVARRFPESPKPTDALFDELYPAPADDEPLSDEQVVTLRELGTTSRMLTEDHLMRIKSAFAACFGVGMRSFGASDSMNEGERQAYATLRTLIEAIPGTPTPQGGVQALDVYEINDMPRQRGDDSTPIELRKNGAHVGQFWSYDSAIAAALKSGASLAEITSGSEVVRLILEDRQRQQVQS